MTTTRFTSPAGSVVTVVPHGGLQVRNVLSGAAIGSVTADQARSAIDDINHGIGDAEGIARDALRLLREGGTFAALDWKCRAALGDAVVAAVLASPGRLAVPASDALHAIIQENVAAHRGRAEYYPQFDNPRARGLDSLPTEGWGSLEVAMWALRGIVDSSECAGLVDTPRLAAMALAGASHENRYVRQVSFAVLAAVCRRARDPSATLRSLVASGAHAAIARGLSDEWAQVRFSAAQAARAILDMCPSDRSFLPAMLPALFVSRHDAAEGVRLQAAVNWRLAVNLSGKQLLATHVAPVVSLLSSMCASGSHELRSAACTAAGELAAAVSQRAVRQHSQELLRAILVGLRDSHWAVKMAACNAYHDFAGAFPAVARSREFGAVDLLLRLNEDETACVREASAAALGAWARAFGQEERDVVARPVLLARTRQLLGMIREEPVPEGATRDSVCEDALRRAHFNDAAVHTSQTALGCCSLEPSHGHHEEHREAAPWQLVTGGAYLAREIAALWPDDEVASLVLPLMDEAYRARWFVHFPAMHAAILQQLPRVLENLGERAKRFKDLPLISTPSK